jgi:hypothetical protein
MNLGDFWRWAATRSTWGSYLVTAALLAVEVVAVRAGSKPRADAAAGIVR